MNEHPIKDLMGITLEKLKEMVDVDTIIGKLSGIIATAIVNDVISAFRNSCFKLNTSINNITTATSAATFVICLLRTANFFCSGVVASSSSCINLAIFPISVSSAVPVTTAFALPFVIRVDI